MVAREATESDRYAYLRMVKDFHAAGAFPFALDIARQNAIFDVSLSSSEMTLWIAEDDETPCGFLLASCRIAALSGEKICQENILWIDPVSRRGKTAFSGLMAVFLAWGEELSVDRYSLTAQASMRPEATGRLFRRYGFEETERHYIRRK